MLRMHSSRCPGFPLDQLRQSEPTGMGGLGRFFPAPYKKSPRSFRNRRPSASERRRVGPAEQARAEVEPSVPAGAWDGAGGGPAVLLRAVDRPRRIAVLVHGRRIGGGGDGAAHVRGRRAFVPSVAAVPSGVRFERIAGRRMRETCVGPTRDCCSLFAVPQGLLV